MRKSKSRAKSRATVTSNTVLFKEHALITLEENHTLKIKNDNLVQRVRYTEGLIEDAESAIKERDKKKLALNEWQAFLACDKIPKPFKPEAIRLFFNKISYFEEQDIENTVNWELAIDERSILNQDIDSVDLTKRVLKQHRPNFGIQYDARVNETMQILRRMQDFTEKPTRVLSDRILEDVEEVKFFAYKQISNYIDNLTYRILCSESAYMESIDVTSAEYTHEAKHFDIHLWTLKNVPIYLDPEDTPTKSIDFYQTKTKLTMPFSVINKNMVIRVLHCHFDHFSAHARYFKLPKTKENETNLKTCLQNEWDSQMKLQKEVRATMVKQRADFEEAQRIKKEEEELKAKQQKKQQDSGKPELQKKKSDKPAKPKKGFKEPPTIAPNVVPRVRLDFLHQDFVEYEDFMMASHPESLLLSTGEINLRKYQILGGVYQLNCLSKPRVTNFPKLIMTWYNVQRCIEHQKIKTEVGASQTLDVSKFFEITFELPEYFCHWGEPLPCLFEEGESYSRAKKLNRAEQVINVGSPIIINDFNLHELFTKPLMYNFIESTIPRIISSFKFPEDLHEDDEERKTKTTLGRAKMTSEEQDREKELLMQKHMMSFGVQNCPERLFPLFKNVMPIVILPTQEVNKTERTHPYEHFSEFMSALEEIKNSYRKSTFKDKLGNTVNISAERYEKNIRRPRKYINVITSKFILHDKDDGRSSEEPAAGSSRDSTSESGDSTHTARAAQFKKSSIALLDSRSKLVKQSSRMIEKSKSGFKIVNDEVEEAEPDAAEEIADKKEVIQTIDESKWSTVNILKTEFNAQDKKVTIWTDRLGTFGFAFYHYQHFPFKSWSVNPSEEKYCLKLLDTVFSCPREVEIKIVSEFAIFRIYITPAGYKALVTDFTQYVKKRKIYLEIKEPLADMKILKEKFQEKNLNIFRKHDASWYMNGYFSEKHLASELHTYNCMSLYATSLKFVHSIWNKLSNRRDMVLKFGELRDLEEDFFLIRVTPEDVVFVDIKEVCTDLETIELEYTPTWRNLEWYPDLNHLILSTFGDAVDWRLKDPAIIYYLKNIFKAIRPLSCS